MYKSIIVSAALVATTAYAGTPGQAVVINGCNYPVHLSSVPAQFGGYETTDHVLQPKDSYSQQWTELTNGAGWSIKLAKESGATSIMQYEYTFHNDGTIWYDLSCVDGNPWDKNWEIAAAGDKNCSPRQAAYRYATDDAYGMQSCSSDASLTVALCSGESQNDDLVSAIASIQTAGASLVVSAPAVAPTSSSPAPVVQTPTTTAAPSPAQSNDHGHGGVSYSNGNFYNANNKADTPTTLATVTSAASAPFNVVAAKKQGEDGDVFTVWQTVVETAIAYETYTPGKRHVHHPEHPQFR